MGGTNLPRGLNVKNGIKLSDAGSRPWFGVLADGTPVIGSAADYSKYAATLENAVGGWHFILKNGKISDVGVGSEHGDTRHPRTAVGIMPDGTVVIIVVDGRQPAISNGASLAEMAILLREMGCINGLELDGGGSSTFVLKEDSSFVTKNNVSSGGTLRNVATSLLICLPE